jgi:hypothetical protein
MQQLRATLFDIGASGGTRPVTVETGLRYPFRLLAVNPPPVSGTLRATSAGNLTTNQTGGNRNPLSKVRQACGYDDGDYTDVPTHTLEYEPDYNLYRDAPRTVYDNTALYQRGDDTTITVANQSFIEDETINIVLLSSRNYSVSRAGTATVDLKSGYRGSANINLDRGNAADLNVTFPTELNATGNGVTWTRLLNDEGSVTDVRQADANRVSLTLDEGNNYEVTCYAVGLDETPETGYRPLGA